MIWTTSLLPRILWEYERQVQAAAKREKLMLTNYWGSPNRVLDKWSLNPSKCFFVRYCHIHTFLNILWIAEEVKCQNNLYLQKLTGGKNNYVKYGVVCPVEDKRTDVIVRELIMAASVSRQDNGWLLRRSCICNSFTLSLFFFCQAFVSFFWSFTFWEWTYIKLNGI